MIVCSRLLKVYKKIHKFVDVLNYFTTQEWTFTNDQLRAMMSKFSSYDRKNFNCDIRNLEWEVYFETYLRGIRVYLIKDPMDTLPQARVRWQRYKIFDIKKKKNTLKLLAFLYSRLKLNNQIFFIHFNDMLIPGLCVQ